MKKGGRELGSAQPWCPRNKAQLVREQFTSFRFVFGHEYPSSYVGRQQKHTAYRHRIGSHQDRLEVGMPIAMLPVPKFQSPEISGFACWSAQPLLGRFCRSWRCLPPCCQSWPNLGRDVERAFVCTFSCMLCFLHFLEPGSMFFDVRLCGEPYSRCFEILKLDSLQ